MAIVQYRSRRPYIDGYAQSKFFRLDLQGTKPSSLFGQAQGWDHSRRPARTLLVHLSMPVPQLLAKILLIVKPSHLEEGGLDETYKVLHAALLLRTVRPAQLHTDAHLQRCVGED